MNLGEWRLDSTSVAGSSVFSALAIILAATSQALGLNFPLIPYLQFDLGEVAIILAFFLFGPMPALVASFVEFGGLEVFGQNLPVGPPLKLIALMSTVAGLWVGAKLAARGGGTSLGRVTAWSTVFASATRAVVMTAPNLYLILYFYGFAAIEGYLKGTFSIVGIGLTDSNALLVILGFTAIFNVVQLVFVMVLTSFVLRVPAISQIRIGGRVPWFVTVVGPGSRVSPQAA
jgi:riboflavin transporter FmnP